MSTENTTDAAAFDAIAGVLAGFGHKLEQRTALKFGKDVGAALASIKSGGFVAVACKGTEDGYMTQIRKDVAAHPDYVMLIDARTNEYSQVRPHVKAFVTSRKLKAAVTPPRKNDEDVNCGFIVRKDV
jgi:hypothetical protein